MTNQSHVRWTVFADHQQTDPCSIDQSLAREEALTAILEEITNDPSISAERTRMRFASLCRNRSSKYRHRRHLERHLARPSHKRCGFGSLPLTPPDPDVFQKIAWAEHVELVRGVLSKLEFRLLWEIAEGNSYSDAARELRISVTSVKAKVFRTRERVRKGAIGQVLCIALGIKHAEVRQ